jgi:hypothetical protein
MIRRELPLTNGASPADGLSHREERGFSFVLAPATADLVLELDCLVQGFVFPFWEGFLFLSFHAAMGCRQAVSALMAMAQIKPNSSRPTPVMIFL